MRKDVIKCGIAAIMLAVLAGCTTLPSPPSPMASSETDAAAPPPVSPSQSRLAAFIAKRLHKKAEPSVAPAGGEAVKAPEVAVDDKYSLTGEAARELERGDASWYGSRFHGRRTANGERYDMYALTAAHKTLPFGTIVRVRSLTLGREVDVRINDRGPFAPGRVIDVSKAAAEVLGLMGAGVAEVSLNVAETLDKATPPPRKDKKIHKVPRRSRQAPAARHR